MLYPFSTSQLPHPPHLVSSNILLLFFLFPTVYQHYCTFSYFFPNFCNLDIFLSCLCHTFSCLLQLPPTCFNLFFPLYSFTRTLLPPQETHFVWFYSPHIFQVPARRFQLPSPKVFPRCARTRLIGSGVFCLGYIGIFLIFIFPHLYVGRRVHVSQEMRNALLVSFTIRNLRAVLWISFWQYPKELFCAHSIGLSSLFSRDPYRFAFYCRSWSHLWQKLLTTYRWTAPAAAGNRSSSRLVKVKWSGDGTRVLLWFALSFLCFCLFSTSSFLHKKGTRKIHIEGFFFLSTTISFTVSLFGICTFHILFNINSITASKWTLSRRIMTKRMRMGRVSACKGCLPICK